MTTASNSAILDPVTNPVPTVAPQSKEDTTMSGATNKITALYCRLSQEDARLGESLSIENQKAILLEYAKKNHFPNPVFFVDDGYSGTNYDRPGFQSMLVEIEAGRVGIVITKDLSRLGRNSALTGLYTNFTFPQYGVRYIAINDNYDTIDPNSVNNDFAGIKNWFNEFYARDTSRKIRAVQKAKGERGVPLTVNVPYGYVKDPENLKHWLVDPEAAAIVKRIFSMCMEGRGPTQIANQLWVDKVLTPTAYKLSHGLSTNSPAPEDPYRWDKRAVSSILERLEYTGCTVNFKTYTNSIWDKKRHLNPVENQAICTGPCGTPKRSGPGPGRGPDAGLGPAGRSGQRPRSHTAPSPPERRPGRRWPALGHGRGGQDRRESAPAPPAPPGWRRAAPPRGSG